MSTTERVVGTAASTIDAAGARTEALEPQASATPATDAPEAAETYRIYGRASSRTGKTYYYGDFRHYADVGGRREKLAAANGRRATTDVGRAQDLYAKRVAAYEARRQRLGTDGLPYDPRLGPIAEYFIRRLLLLKTKEPRTIKRHLSACKQLVSGFKNARLSDIRVSAIEAYIEHRRESGAAHSTILNELTTLSGIFRRAIAIEVFDRNFVALLPDRPKRTLDEAVYLTREQLAALLDAAVEEEAEVARAQYLVGLEPAAIREALGLAEEDAIPPSLYDTARRYLYAEAVLTTFAYCGGRHEEVFGLEFRDLDFAKGLIHIRPNRYRRLKRTWHRRILPMHPPLRAVLLRYLAASGQRQGLLFPNRNGGLITGLRGTLARCVARAGILADGPIGYHTLRHTYATIALQTYLRTKDGEFLAPSAGDVAELLGHRTSGLIEEVYKHIRGQREYYREFGCEWLRQRPVVRREEATPQASVPRANLMLVA
ncbi:MAG TPA: tyrosine-type recombinase/integrase [Gemmatimonadales bacterium]|nr:tyrosine-type recombinase/integrase [Gemmatimonadales bacterium]